MIGSEIMGLPQENQDWNIAGLISEENDFVVCCFEKQKYFLQLWVHCEYLLSFCHHNKSYIIIYLHYVIYEEMVIRIDRNIVC